LLPAKTGEIRGNTKKRSEKIGAYPLRYTEDFFARFDEVVNLISSTVAEYTFETSSRLDLYSL
jgi:hypothetical protein